MSQANVELVRRANALANKGDFHASRRLSHPDVEWVIAREHPNARTLVGHEALAAYEQEWLEAVPNLRIDYERVLDAGDRVLAVGTVRGAGAGSGADVHVPIAMVFTFREGLVARVEEFLNPAEAFEAVGLAE
jgi:ketosteroid isomerase-like protein